MRTLKSLAILGFLVSFAACAGRSSSTLPAELHGVWRNPAHDYEGRYLELRAGEMILGLGDGAEQVYEVLHVEPEEEYGITSYAITFRVRGNASGETDSLTLVFEPNLGALRFQNQELRWWRYPLASDPSSSVE